MEFFAELTNRDIAAGELHELLTISRLPEFCSSIDAVLSIHSPEKGEIYCVWGRFHISRENIRNGVRFALLNCPHALAWTVTSHADARAVVIHCTIDKREAEQEFIDSIEQFISEWASGLTGILQESAQTCI